MKGHTFKNAIILSFAGLMNVVSGAVIVIAIARILDKTSLGFFSFSFALGSILCIIGLYGITELIIREVAADPAKGGDYFANGSVVRGVMLVFLMTVLALTLAVKYHSPVDRLIVFLFVFVRVVESMIFMYCGFFRAFHQMEYEGMFRFILNLTNLIVTLFVVFKFRNLISVAIWQAAFYTVFFAWLCVFIKRKYKFSFWRAISWPKIVELLKKGYKFSLITIFIVLLVHINTVILDFIKGELSTGIYSASFRFVSALGMLGAGAAGAFYPVMSRYHGAKKIDIVGDVFFDGFKYLLLASLFLSMFLYCFADKLIFLIYGAKYTQSIICLKIIAPSIIFGYLNTICSRFLMSTHREGVYFRYLAGTVIFAIILNFILVPLYGYIGASWTTVLPSMSCFILQFRFIRKHVSKLRDNVFLIKLFLPALITLAVLYFLRGYSSLILMPLSFVIYMVLVGVSGIINKKEMEIFTKFLRRKKLKVAAGID